VELKRPSSVRLVVANLDYCCQNSGRQGLYRVKQDTAINAVVWQGHECRIGRNL
jgi:hypothetical protein